MEDFAPRGEWPFDQNTSIHQSSIHFEVVEQAKLCHKRLLLWLKLRWVKLSPKTDFYSSLFPLSFYGPKGHVQYLYWWDVILESSRHTVASSAKNSRPFYSVNFELKQKTVKKVAPCKQPQSKQMLRADRGAKAKHSTNGQESVRIPM